MRLTWPGIIGCGSAAEPATSASPAVTVTAAAPSASSGAPQASPVPDGTQGSPAPGANTPPAAGGRPPAVSDPGARVEADDQSGDGRSVVVREAAVTVGPGWLAIITDDDDRLLGSVALQPGQAGPFTVALTEPVPGDDDDDLTVVLHLDDGDGLFDALRDPRVLDDDDDDDDDDDIEDDDFDYDLG